MAADMERPMETGWLADTPVGDTLLRRFVHNQADHNEAMAAAHRGRADRTDAVFLADSGCPVPYLNQAILARPVLSPDDPVLDVVDGFFEGRAGVTLLSIWPSADLSGRGWSLVGHPALVARAPGPVSATTPDGVDTRRAETAADFETAERVAVEGYPLDSAGAAPAGSVLPATLAGGPMTVRLGLLDGAAVAIGNVFVGHGVVNLALGATLPAARRRGVWEALVWARVAEDPGLPAVAYTSDYSRPGFLRMGFMPLTRFTLWWR
jgi:hypothetical protein